MESLGEHPDHAVRCAVEGQDGPDDVVIHSRRCQTLRGRRAVREWLRRHAADRWDDNMVWARRGLKSVRLAWKKPKAVMYIDDLAWRFEGPGTFPSEGQIQEALPWNRR